jgi:hypothetical protein
MYHPKKKRSPGRRLRVRGADADTIAAIKIVLLGGVKKI